jgi:hypothetical protein
MAIYTGDTGTVKVGTTAIGSIKSWSYEISAGAIDTTVMDGGDWSSFVKGRKAWTGTAELLVDNTDVGQLELGIGEEKSGVEFFFDDTNSTTAAKGTAMIESVSVNSSTGEMVTLSVSFKGTGALDTDWQG